MRDHGQEERFDVLGHDVRPPGEQGPRAGRLLERERGSHRSAERHAVECPRDTNQLEQPVHEQTVDVDVLDGAVQLEQLVRGHGGLQLSERVAVPLLEHDAPLAVQVGVAERRLQEEAVELCPGSGKVPSCSIGFSVSSRNGFGSGRVAPPTVTWVSAIASSSADCVFGIAR